MQQTTALGRPCPRPGQSKASGGQSKARPRVDLDFPLSTKNYQQTKPSRTWASQGQLDSGPIAQDNFANATPLFNTLVDLAEIGGVDRLNGVVAGGLEDTSLDELGDAVE